MLELKDIKKSYLVGGNRQQVLKGIDIKFRDNEFTSILGSSGSGKTTLLNIIGGLDKYDSGDLIIDGVSTKSFKDRDWDSYRNYRVGFIFQSYNLIMHQSVLSNVEIALTLSGVSKEERRKRATDALIKVGLKDHVDKKPNQLSGGQMQRVAIARALVNDPEIILADEPTGALDSKTSVQIMDLLKEIAKDKLVIMVTHNPELAKEYSTRIIELKDGVILNDSNPYKKDEKKTSERIINRTSMSLLSALSLSFNNLLTKKGRTFLTAFAGSIGIIGIALILSLTNGVNNYAKSLERDSLSDYPISIERTSYDLFGSLSSSLDEEFKVKKCADGKLCSRDDVVKNRIIDTNKGTIKKNDTRAFKKYIEEHKEIDNYVTKINYGYDVTLQVFNKDYDKVNPSNIANGENLFTELTDDSKYKLIEGSLPKEKNELLIVVGENRQINDSTLYALGLRNKSDLLEDFEKIAKNHRYTVPKKEVSYSDIINKTFKLVLNTDYYIEQGGTFVDYSGNTAYMKNKIDNGLELKIVGIAEDKSLAASKIQYRHDLVEYVISETSKTNIFKRQIENKDINVLTGKAFDGITSSYEQLVKELGIYEFEDPSSISLYPKDYDSKEKIVDYIKTYNDEKKANNENDSVIEYSDLMKSIVGGITQIVNIISVVLIGFVAISLVVSSIMIAIITYISVLERTKEIGILRAIGASKKDVKRVFIAETIIEGFIAGALGILIAFIITLPINVIVKALGNIDNIANLSIVNSAVLIGLSILLNVVAGIKPASMAAKKDPVEALRSE